MHSGAHIIDKALSGPLAIGRTIILVTHHVKACLPVASFVVELSNGGVILNGSVENLQQSGHLEKLVELEDEDFLPMESSTKETVAAFIDDDTDDSPRRQETLSVHLQLNNGKTAKKLVEDEARAEGRVSLDTYLSYIRASGWITWLTTVVLMFAIRGYLYVFDVLI